MGTYKQMNDESLIVLYAKGDNDAFDVLLDRLKGGLFTYISYHVRNRDVAEDIFQETFVKVITTVRQGKYTETGKFKAWVTRIAHNLIIDYFRQERSENHVSNDETESDLFNNAKLCDGTIEDELVYTQVMTDVRKLIRFLPDNQREVLEMRYYLNLSFKEIAEQTGVSINTALGRMRYAILNMRRMAAEHNVELSLS
ncbi:MAG: sigma-70 family RNA polymerase sigma factor [Tannerellaceae bacterium]|jgi:RNA polymerase sigma-70 factor (ECF subfamily)|nr:sigma-70 family RNA polymerase sigma factor [Tannerellaceae bacterium]